MSIDQYTINELSELTGFPRRTIRYYIQEGLLDPPAGRGRGGFYNDSHMSKLLTIKALQERGLSLAAITGLIKNENCEVQSAVYSRDVWVKYTIAPGLEINVSRDLEQKEGKSITEIIKTARALLKEGGE